ncbi:MAG: extracellular solute-binding protein [Roseiarcus sp.]|jgi:molybdate/tungstate transport system substrate-binding protein
MRKGFRRRVFGLALICATAAPAAGVAAERVELTLLGAGTLAEPFKEVAAAFEVKNPDVAVRSQFGGSVMMARHITDLHQSADLLAVADYTVIPKYLMAPGATSYASWYVGFAQNAITFVYTADSLYAKEVNADNWLDCLTRPNVQIGRSNPDTDPSGYQTLQMLALAERHYNRPGAAEKVLANAPLANMRDTETDLVAALESGQIDYLAIYRSDALQHHLQFLDLPAAINLSDPAFSADYAEAVAHTKNGDLKGKPIIYAVTIPTNAEHPALAARFVAFLLGPEGRAIMAKDGFGTMQKPYATGVDQMPQGLRDMVVSWPSP